MEANSSVGVVGLGQIGSVLVRGLTASGVRTLVYDVDPRAIARQVEVGALAAASVEAIAAECDLVLLAVVTDDQVRSVANALAAGGARTIVVHSTVSPGAVSEIADALLGRVTVVDAPVSDNKSDDVRRLMLYVGVAGRHLPDRVRAAFETYSRDYEILGEVGAGQVMKIANNLMLYVNSAAIREALGITSAYGIDPRRAASLAMRAGSASDILSKWFDVHPRRSIAEKDLGLALDAGARVGLSMPIAAATLTAADIID